MSLQCPLPHYWMCHIVIALVIALLLWWPLGLGAGLTVGAAVYISREIAQWQDGNDFDWKGLFAPVAACFLALLVKFGVEGHWLAKLN
jgi:hypothetical protein